MHKLIILFSFCAIPVLAADQRIHLNAFVYQSRNSFSIRQAEEVLEIKTRTHKKLSCIQTAIEKIIDAEGTLLCNNTHVGTQKVGDFNNPVLYFIKESKKPTICTQ
jgi:hypothetical protein